VLLIQLTDGSANSSPSLLSYKNIHSEEHLKPVFCIFSVLDIMTGLWMHEVQPIVEYKTAPYYEYSIQNTQAVTIVQTN
jgi:hypothetical protein